MGTDLTFPLETLGISPTQRHRQCLKLVPRFRLELWWWCGQQCGDMLPFQWRELSHCVGELGAVQLVVSRCGHSWWIPLHQHIAGLGRSGKSPSSTGSCALHDSRMNVDEHPRHHIRCRRTIHDESWFLLLSRSQLPLHGDPPDAPTRRCRAPLCVRGHRAASRTREKLAHKAARRASVLVRIQNLDRCRLADAPNAFTPHHLGGFASCRNPPRCLCRALCDRRCRGHVHNA